MNLSSLIEHLRTDLPLVTLIALVLVSAVAVIYSKHVSRNEFVQLQKLERARDQLNDEWGRLLLEQSTWANPGRIDQQARIRLNMVVPDPEQTVVIKP